MEKKPYAPPTITEHGNAVKKTKGFGGPNWETMSSRNTSDIEMDESTES